MKKSDQGIEIIKASNGFSIKDQDGNITVIQEDENDELSSTEKLLWHIIEFFGLAGDRYARESIAVIRVAGRKYEPQGDEVLVPIDDIHFIVRKKRPDSVEDLVH
jgi:hypothetical protein